MPPSDVGVGQRGEGQEKEPLHCHHCHHCSDTMYSAHFYSEMYIRYTALYSSAV